MPTIAQAIAEGVRKLHASGIEQERRTAGLLLCHVIGIDRTHLLTKSEEHIDDLKYKVYLRLLERRAAGEPVQYLTGHQEFYGLDFFVTPDVLIPRPETELLIEQVLKIVDAEGLNNPLIVDVGTGSGCIAVTLAANLFNARLIATDASQPALIIALNNAAKHQVTDRIEFLEGDLLEPLNNRKLTASIDLIASNPPYVDEDLKSSIQREVRDWEPHEALFGGVDGIEFYRRLVSDCPEYLKTGGHLVVEIGYGQLEAIESMVAGSPSLKLVEVTNDLQGIPRTLTMLKSEAAQGTTRS
ncbi:MAG TPA: peptide chain release factor N(5)-glutamine methyltransferase [Blastocatellia bacterium]|nr:peptide chain release factor N(5)-glutamine methyltransferase [Blastocatellia bacterium]